MRQAVDHEEGHQRAQYPEYRDVVEILEEPRLFEIIATFKDDGRQQRIEEYLATEPLKPLPIIRPEQNATSDYSNQNAQASLMDNMDLRSDTNIRACARTNCRRRCRPSAEAG
jgi:hypothetical protein